MGGALLGWVLGFGVAAAAEPAALPAALPTAFPTEARYVGRAVPDVVFSTDTGESTLHDYAGDDGLLLALAFTRCSGLCTPFLASLASAEAIAGAGESGGESGVRTLVLSIDPRDTVADMSAMAARFGLANDPAWAFGVAAPADIAVLAGAVGFTYAWDETKREYDHPGLLVALRSGKVVRLLGGAEIHPARLQEVVRELRGEFVGTYPLPGRVLLRCFEYDAAKGQYSLGWGFFALLVPGVCAFAGAGAVFGMARRG